MSQLTSALVPQLEEMPGMAGFDLPDHSHFHYAEAPRFTLALADELVRHGVLRAPR
jgi:hypothetical protein